MLRVAAVVASLLVGLACSPPRVLIVGLDGATWQVMDPLIDAGYLPTIGQLVASGARFDLDCEPADLATACFCPPVWTSIATGRTFADHGIGRFDQPSYARKVPALWTVLRDYGGRSTLLDFRGTWPPEGDADRVLTEPGAQVAGAELFAAFPASDHPGAGMPLTLAKPVDLLEQLGMLPNPVPRAERLAAWRPFSQDRVSMEALLRIATLHAQEPAWTRVPDLTMILLHSPDKSEHVTWSSIQRVQWGPLNVGRLLDDAERYDGPVFNPPPYGWSAVPAQYQEVDAWLGELLDVLEYDYVILVSDHGMTRRTVPGLSGAHDPDHPEAHLGILSITGPGILANRHLGVATVLDVAPTVAYLLGLPVAQDLPGRVLTESFDEPLVYLPPFEVPSWE